MSTMSTGQARHTRFSDSDSEPEEEKEMENEPSAALTSASTTTDDGSDVSSSSDDSSSSDEDELSSYSSSSSSSDESSTSGDESSSSEEEEDGGDDADFEDLEMLLAERAEELAIARSLGVRYRMLETAAVTKYHTSRKMKTVVRRIKRRMDVAAVHRQATRIRQYIKSVLAGTNRDHGGSSKLSSLGNGRHAPEGFTAAVDEQGRRTVTKKVESLEKELETLKALMAEMAKEKEMLERNADAAQKQTERRLPSNLLNAIQSTKMHGGEKGKSNSAQMKSTKVSERRSANEGRKALLSALQRGSSHLKNVEGGRSPGGTPAIVISKRHHQRSLSGPQGGTAKALSDALNKRFHNSRGRDMSVFSLASCADEDETEDSGFSSSGSDEDSDDDASERQVVRVVRLSKPTSRKSKTPKLQQPKPHRQPPSRWGTGQTSLPSSSSFSTSDTCSFASSKGLPSRRVSPLASSSLNLTERTEKSLKSSSSIMNRPPRNRSLLSALEGFDKQKLRQKECQNRRASAPAAVSSTPVKRGLMGAISGFDRSKLKSAKKRDPRDAKTKSKSGSLMDALAGFDRSKLKSAKKKAIKKELATSPPATPKKGGLLDDLASFDRSRLRSAKKERKLQFKQSHAPKRKTPAKATPISHNNILKDAVLNRKLRKVTFTNNKPPASTKDRDSRVDDENSCSSPAFAKFKLRKTGRRSMGGTIRILPHNN